jgi:hypothetical protein
MQFTLLLPSSVEYGRALWHSKFLPPASRWLSPSCQSMEVASHGSLACRSRTAALVSDFSAVEYLPLDVSEISVGSKSKVDWDSIMLYPTGAGGIVEGGARRPVLTKPNGDPIPINLTPSPKDVEGLKILYRIKPDTKWWSLGDKRSSLRNKFKKIRRKDPDSGC